MCSTLYDVENKKVSDILKKIKINKAKLLSICLFLLLLGVVGITYAYYNGVGIFENKFNTKNYNISLEEEFYGTWGTKKVKFKNNDSTSVVLRVSYNELWSLKEEIIIDSDSNIKDTDMNSDEFIEQNDAVHGRAVIQNGLQNYSCKYNVTDLDGNTIFTLSNKINGIDVVTKKWTESWLSEFELGNDGWYYYKKLFNSNDEIQILDSIVLNENLIKDSTCYNNYNDFNYKLGFNYETVQATETAVRDLWGHNISINGGNITWNF